MSSRRKALSSFLTLAALLASFPTHAQTAETDVDVELVLAVDASRSMEPFEQKIQREGYIAAFRRKDVIDAIRDGVHGRVAITYVEWAGSTLQRTIVPLDTGRRRRVSGKICCGTGSAHPIDAKPNFNLWSHRFQQYLVRQ